MWPIISFSGTAANSGMTAYKSVVQPKTTNALQSVIAPIHALSASTHLHFKQRKPSVSFEFLGWTHRSGVSRMYDNCGSGSVASSLALNNIKLMSPMVR
jgi:hypothetical protein